MATWHPVNLTDRGGPLPPHTDLRSRRHGWKLLERLLLVIGAVCLGSWAYISLESALYQRFENRELDAILRSADRGSANGNQESGPRTHGLRSPIPGSTIGRVEIPRLGVSAVIKAGSDSRTLRLAVGHIAGTALPGDHGNVGLAGHRDTFFRRLRDIRPDDRIRVVTPEGTFTYKVARTDVVQPTDVWVLDQTAQSVLTLVTCYPFTYVGSAPERFIVRAELLG
jgi:sortase A